MTSGHPCCEGGDDRCLSWVSTLETRELRGRRDGAEQPREKSSPLSLTKAGGLLKVGREGQVTGAKKPPPSKENPKGFVS